MKRSEVNKYIKEMEQLAKDNGFHLPPFCNWTPEEWKKKGHEYDEIRDMTLGERAQEAKALLKDLGM